MNDISRKEEKVMRLYYDAEQHNLYIDDNNKQTILNIPDDLSQKDMSKFLQSETLYQIISQLKGEK